MRLVPVYRPRASGVGGHHHGALYEHPLITGAVVVAAYAAAPARAACSALARGR